ncbi:MAG: hypothetical protein HY692_03535 [Cyanobacteria bacterium NC_groundwater_1444_Ag_S-0.65um_54_12]|nr:hypothetical protein [Cyanobacteria bacterium NC_groundwater_1444_Ag_S-0.65um_54_12]
MFTLKRLTCSVATLGLIVMLTGCPFYIKLDPGSENARVSVNGEPKGRGQVEYQVSSAYAYPDRFSVKVEPSDSKPYTLEISRELDVPRAVIQTLVSGALGIAYLISDLYYNDGRPSTFTLVVLAYAPLSWLSSYYYKGYYDLQKLAKQQDLISQQPELPIFTGHVQSGPAYWAVSSHALLNVR